MGSLSMPYSATSQQKNYTSIDSLCMHILKPEHTATLLQLDSTTVYYISRLPISLNYQFPCLNTSLLLLCIYNVGSFPIPKVHTSYVSRQIINESIQFNGLSHSVQINCYFVSCSKSGLGFSAKTSYKHDANQ